MTTLLLLIVILAIAFSVPAWPHSRGWGYFPSGGLGAVLLVLLLFMFLRPI
ncbi:MAG: hypothetical protein RL033_836 [Pseudomonadota bacterium]|jgi:hypothetical protein